MADRAPMPVREFYDGLAAGYDAARYGSAHERAVARLELDFVGRFLRPGACLDVGAGTGRVTRFVLDRGHSVTAVDLSARMLDRLERNVGRHPWLATRQLDVLQLEELDGYGEFPNVVALRMLAHVRDPLAAIAKLRGALAPGGVLVIDLWNARSHRALLMRLGLSRMTVYTRHDTIAAMRRMIHRAGLSVRSHRGFGLPPLGALLFFERSSTLRCDAFAHRIVWVCGCGPEEARGKA
jgi:SAM-dependent methyltransferase